MTAKNKPTLDSCIFTSNEYHFAIEVHRKIIIAEIYIKELREIKTELKKLLKNKKLKPKAIKCAKHALAKVDKNIKLGDNSISILKKMLPPKGNWPYQTDRLLKKRGLI